MKKPSPLTAAELIAIANGHIKVPIERVLATFADESNWVQLYHCESAARGYEPKACEWAFVGPVRPPYELAQWALKQNYEPENRKTPPTLRSPAGDRYTPAQETLEYNPSTPETRVPTSDRDRDAQ